MKKALWTKAIEDAKNALQTLDDLRSDLEDEFSERSESFQESDKGGAQQELIDFSFSEIHDQLVEVEDVLAQA